MNKKLNFALTTAVSFALASSIYAADDTWDGDTNALWNDANNWVGGAIPGALDTATFSSGSPTNTTIDLGAGVTIQDIVFGASPSITVGSGAVNSQTITRSTGGNIFANSTADHLVNAAIVLGEVGDASTSFNFQNQGTTNLLTFAGDITNNGNAQTFSMQGLGTIVLTGNNSYGNTVVQNGTLILGSNTAVGTGNNVTVQSQNSATGIKNDVTLDIAGQNIVVNTLTLGHATTTAYGAGQTPQVIDSVGGGTIRINSLKYEAGSAGNLNGTGTISADLTWNSNKSFTVEDGGSDTDLVFSGSIIDGGLNPNALIKSGTGTLLLTGGDKIAVNTILHRGGTIAFTDDSQLSSGDVVVGWNAASTTLEYVGTGGSTNNRIDIGRSSATNATYTGGAIIESNGTGAITFSNGMFNDPIAQAATISRDLTFGGANTGDNTISGVIADNDAGGTINVIKQDAGKWILNGNNTYTGTTSVNAGRLDIGGVNTGTGAFTVADGASLGGEGSVAAPVTIGSSTGANLHVDPTTASAFSANNGLDISNGTQTIILEKGPTTTGAFTVLNYAGTLTGTTGNLQVQDAANYRTTTFADTSTSITLDLGNESHSWVGGDVTNPSYWDIGTTNNWASSDNKFYNLDIVTFDDSATSYAVALQSDITAGSVNFANDTNTYTLAGGGNTLTIADEIVFQGNADATVNAVIAGSGSLTLGDNNDGISDGANLSLNAANTFTGGVNITEGILFITDSNALGTGSVSITDAGSNSNRDPDLRLNADNLNVANDITITNDGFQKKITFDIGGAGTSELSGTLTLLETIDRVTSINVGANDTLTVSGVVSGNGVFNKRGAGTVVLTNETSDHTGILMTQEGGVLEFTSIADSGVASAAGAGSFLTLGYRNSDGTLRYSGDGDSTNRQIRIGEDYTGTNRTGGGTLENNGTGALVFTNANFNQVESGAYVGARTLTLSGTNTDANEIQGVIADNNYTGIDAISDAVSLVKSGAGTWTLSGTNTYTGSTTVEAGTLVVSGSGSINGTSGIVVSSAGTLDYSSSVALTASLSFTGTGNTLTGSGTINTAVTITSGNILSVGNSPGTMNFASGLTLDAGSSTIAEIDGSAGAGVVGGHDFHNVTGALNYGGDLSLVFGTGALDDGSYSWDLFDFDSETGTFDSIVLSGDYTGSLLDLDTNGVWDLVSGDNTWQFSEATGVLELTVVPEPSTFALLAGLTGLACVMVRRRRA